MLSTEGFFFLQKVKVCYDTVDNEVSASARLTFYENLFIGQETSVRSVHQRVSVLGGLSLEKMYGVSPGTKKAVRKNEMSRFKWVSARVDFHCHVIFKSVTFTVYIHSVRAFKTPSVKQLYGSCTCVSLCHVKFRVKSVYLYIFVFRFPFLMALVYTFIKKYEVCVL